MLQDVSKPCSQLQWSWDVQVARLRCALARYLVWEVNASSDFRYQVRASPSLPSQPCLLQLATMLKQAAKDRKAVNTEQESLLVAIQAGSSTPGSQQLALQVCSHTLYKTVERQ